MHETARSAEALLLPYMAEMRASLHPEALFDSLVERLAMQQLALADLRRETASLRAALKLRDVLLPEAHAVHAPAQRYRIVAAMPLRLEDGFYPLEYDGEGQPFRWTGPTRPSISKPISIAPPSSGWCCAFRAGARRSRSI